MKTVSILTILATIAVGVSASNDHRQVFRQQHRKTARSNTLGQLSRKPNDHCKPRNYPIVTPQQTGLINVPASASSCPIGATQQITATTGPNGSSDYFTCGIDSDAGWNPPHLTFDMFHLMSLNDALKNPNGAFGACAPYADIINQAAAANNIPSLALASVAMQESGCNPWTQGGGGEAGMMQLTSDKCGNAPNGNCFDVSYNIWTGAAFYASLLGQNNGDVLLTIGRYNGWYKGLTHAAATAAQYSGCCRCQNNLDYPQQTLNGWYLNVNPYTRQLGKFFNLAVCFQS